MPGAAPSRERSHLESPGRRQGRGVPGSGGQKLPCVLEIAAGSPRSVLGVCLGTQDVDGVEQSRWGNWQQGHGVT